MRPQGEIRRVLSKAAEDLYRAEARAVTWRAMAEASQVGYSAARRTVCNMTRAGELRIVGQVRVAGAMRPMNTYAPAHLAPQQQGPALGDVMRAWTTGAATR